jgi:hypothetical protein
METPDKDLDIKPADDGPQTIDLCAAQRAAVKAKEAEITGLQGMRAALQWELVHAPPGQKADIVDEIEQVNSLLDQAEAALSGLQGLLDRCENRFPRGQEVSFGGIVIVMG